MRESVDVEVRGTPVRVVRSSKRTKTVSAAWREGRLQVNLPWGLSEQAAASGVELCIYEAGGYEFGWKQ